jgi:adenosylcobinamide-phosphate synthase
MLIHHLLSITIAIVLDRRIGDPPSWPHPVKWIGTLILKLEQKLNKGPNRKGKGVGMLFVVLLAVFLPTWLIIKAAYSIHPIVGVIGEGIIIATTIAHKNLKDSALEVFNPLKRKDLREARLKLSYIVGRDTEQLGEGEIVRGTVETVAENTSDGVTAPLFWAWIGGAPFAILYRAINTCDSMVGYRNARYLEFGWASARMDDLANWIPSRLTALTMLLSNRPFKRKRKEAWRIVLRDARKHPSPNSGWCESAAAALLGVQLGGINTYKGIVSNRARMGDELFPLEKKHIVKMNRILSQTVLLFFLLLWLGGVLIDMAIAWS